MLCSKDIPTRNFYTMEIMEINVFKGVSYKAYNRLEEAKQALFNAMKLTKSSQGKLNQGYSTLEKFKHARLAI
jgi:hypothetical protein